MKRMKRLTLHSSVPESRIREMLPDVVWWNKFMNEPSQITKYFGDKSIRWHTLNLGDEPVALASVYKAGQGPVDGEVFLAQIVAKPGHGYGKSLVNQLYRHYRKREDSKQTHSIGFTANPDAGEGLLNYYRKTFGEDGWVEWTSNVGWHHFQKMFRRELV